jgi:Domain of unknown function (DUF4342)
MTPVPQKPPEEQHVVWEKFQVQGEHLVEQVKKLVHEGNVRRIVVKHEGQTVVELPVTVGVVGAVLAPMLAAVGAIGAILTQCTIEVERRDVA